MRYVYNFERRGRSMVAALTLAAIYSALAWGLVYLSLSPWLVGAVFVLTLPAVWDMIRDTRSGMEINRDGISWFHGSAYAIVAFADIKIVHIDLRLDRSVKLTIHLNNGKKIRVAQPSIPPLRQLERALPRVNIPFQKNPFSLI